MDINDDTNMVGLGTLINPKHADASINFEQVEKDMLGGATSRPLEEIDPAKEFNDTINELSAEIGINLNVEEGEEGMEPAISQPTTIKPVVKQQSTVYHEPRPAVVYNRPTNFNEALKAYNNGPTELDMAIEDEQEAIALMLEDIDDLRSELTKDNIDITGIQAVDSQTPPSVIKNVHKILRRKYDKKRCGNLGKEIFLFGAQGLGYIFDGRKKYGPFQPNLKGWHNTVRTKLSRMQYDVQNVTSSVVDYVGVGSLGRIALELVPSAFLHSSAQTEARSNSNYSSSTVSGALADLSEYETK